MRKIGLFFYVCVASYSLSFPLYAECLPTPDCASLGYNKSAADCPRGYIKCPWDTEMVFCTAGNGACENIGKKSCNNLCVPADGCCADDDCASGFLCDLKTRMCKQVCAPGDFYYSDLTCSADFKSDKAPVGVVGFVTNRGMDGLVVAKSHAVLSWGIWGVDLLCIPNIGGAVAGALPFLSADYNGKAYTACIMAQAANCGSGTYPAGENCNSLTIENISGWYLPSSGELYEAIVANRTPVNTALSEIAGAATIPTTGQGIAYWSSTEWSDSAAWTWSFRNESWGWTGKTYTSDSYHTYVARCVLPF